MPALWGVDEWPASWIPRTKSDAYPLLLWPQCKLVLQPLPGSLTCSTWKLAWKSADTRRWMWDWNPFRWIPGKHILKAHAILEENNWKHAHLIWLLKSGYCNIWSEPGSLVTLKKNKKKLVNGCSSLLKFSKLYFQVLIHRYPSCHIYQRISWRESSPAMTPHLFAGGLTCGW